MSTLLVLFVACFCSSAVRAELGRFTFDIAANDSAEKALNEFVSQSGILMLYDPADVQGFATHAVNGSLTGPQALRQMMAGSNLKISFEDNFSFVTLRPAIPRAKGDAKSGSAEIDTDVATTARLTYQPLVDEFDGLEEVVVTGTHIHSALDIISPLERVTRKEINKATYSTVQDVLRQLPMSFGGTPSETAATVGNYSRGTAANLRGLGAGATLVLLNGHRLPYSGTDGDFVDVSTIPTGAVDRIEVLPDGASSLYGSDAIAGVVNIITETNLDGGESRARLGVTPAGASEKVVNQMLGTSWSGGSALLSYQFSDRTSLEAADRVYLASSDKRPLGGTDHRSFASIPGNILDPGTFLPTFGVHVTQDGTPFFSNDLNLQNQWSSYDVLPNRRNHSVFLSGSQNLGDEHELYGELLYSHRSTSQELFGYEQVLFVPASNPFFSTPYAGMPFVAVDYNFLNDLGAMRATTKSDGLASTLGVKLQWGNRWHLDLSQSYGRDAMSFMVDNQPDIYALNLALADSDPLTAFNPFGAGSHNNPQTLARIRTDQHGKAISQTVTTSAIADGPIGHVSAGEVKLALGVERREEKLSRDVFTRNAFRRDVNSAFAELSIPLFGKAHDLYAVPRVELSLAGRFESYSDFGTTTNPKVGLRWAPFNSLKIRTSWGTSFRAPKLVDLYNTAQNASGLRSVEDPLSPIGSSVVLQVLGNNPNLKEETASTWATGLDFAPASLPGLTASLTYFTIDYKNQVSTPSLASQGDILVDVGQSASRVIRNPTLDQINAICNSPTFFGQPDQCAATSIAAIVDFGPRNLARTRVQGFDFKLDQVLDTSYGKFDFGVDGAYTLHFERAASRASPVVDVLDTVSNPLKFKMRATVDWYQHAWNMPGFGINASLDHSGGYEDVLSSPRRSVGAWTTLDLRLSYRTARDAGMLDDMEFALNAANLFDRDPPFVDSEMGFDAANALPYGRVISFSLQKRW